MSKLFVIIILIATLSISIAQNKIEDIKDDDEIVDPTGSTVLQIDNDRDVNSSNKKKQTFSVLDPVATPLPGNDNHAFIQGILWNSSDISMISNEWGKTGLEALNQQFPSINAIGYKYTADSIKWVDYLLKPDYIPKDIEYYLLPISKDKLITYSDVDLLNEMHVDGYIVRYKTGKYLFQISDSSYDIQIVIRNLEQKKIIYTTAEMQSFGYQLMKQIMKESLYKYEDGTFRKQAFTIYPDHIRAQWNWLISDKKKENNEISSSFSCYPFSCFAEWYSDGCSVLINFHKIYFNSRIIQDWPVDMRTRYNYNVLFHDESEMKNIDPFTSVKPSQLQLSNKVFTAEVQTKDWNDSITPLIINNWGNINIKNINQNIPEINSQGYEYTDDCIKWLTYVMKQDYIPKGIEYRLLPMANGKITSVLNNDVTKGRKTDGFVVRYQINNYLFQITDSLYDLQIAVRDLGQKKDNLTKEEQQAFGESIAQMVLNDTIIKYTDGSLRKQKKNMFNTYMNGQWNWMITDKNAYNPLKDTTSKEKPFESIARWNSDGYTTILHFNKNYNNEIPIEKWSADQKTRYSKNAVFHDDIKK